MKTLLIETLETICPNNVYLQGTLTEAYPDSFITFWTNYTNDHSHYDNDVKSVDWTFNVIYYSSDPELIESVPPQIREALKQVGFVPQGKGFDIPSDEPTHTGWTMDFVISETL